MKQVNVNANPKTARKLGRLLMQGTSIGLCLALGLSMAGCKKSNAKPVETVTADTAYFSSTELEFYEAEEGEDVSVISVKSYGDKVAILLNIYEYNNLMYEKEYAAVVEEKTGTAETVAVETAAGETAASETVPEETTAADETTVSDETAIAEETAPDSTAVTDETMIGIDEPIIDPDMEYIPPKYYILIYDNTGKLMSQIDLGSVMDPNSYPMSMAADADGNLMILLQGYDEETGASSFLMYSVDAAGKLGASPVKLAFGDYDYPNQMTIDKDGNMYFTSYGEQGLKIMVFDSKGKPLYEITGGKENLNGNLYVIGDLVYVDGSDFTDDKYKSLLYPLDTAGKKLGEPIDMTRLSMYGGEMMYIGANGVYSNSSIGVYQLDIEEQTKTPVLLWKDADIARTMYGNDQVVVLSSDKIMLISSIYGGESTSTKVTLLTREATNPNAGKIIIRIAGVGITYDAAVLSAVYEFNKSNTEYRVEIHDYMEDQPINSEEDYNKVINTMNMEILSGDGPDIIFGSYQSFANYEAKDLLVDLYTLMEKDTDFKKDDYIPSVLKLCETDGHLYKFGTGFMIQGFVGAKSVIGDRMGWTVDEFNEMVNSLPSGMTPLVNQTQSNLLTNSLYASMDSFVNAQTGEVTFNTEDFWQLLDYAKTYGTDDDNPDQEYSDEMTMLQNGELALASCYIGDPTGYGQYAAMINEPISVVGFPSSDKRGPMCYVNTMLAISSESGSQEAAWDFVKSFFSEDAQMTIAENYSIPVLKSAFEFQIERAMNPDENGGGMVIYDKMGQMQPMTEDEAQEYRDLINGLDTLASFDMEISNIILEETPAFFNGQKSEQDIAAIIQNRVQTLVNERE